MDVPAVFVWCRLWAASGYWLSGVDSGKDLHILNAVEYEGLADSDIVGCKTVLCSSQDYVLFCQLHFCREQAYATVWEKSLQK